MQLPSCKMGRLAGHAHFKAHLLLHTGLGVSQVAVHELAQVWYTRLLSHWGSEGGGGARFKELIQEYQDCC